MRLCSTYECWHVVANESLPRGCLKEQIVERARGAAAPAVYLLDASPQAHCCALIEAVPAERRRQAHKQWSLTFAIRLYRRERPSANRQRFQTRHLLRKDELQSNYIVVCTSLYVADLKIHAQGFYCAPTMTRWRQKGRRFKETQLDWKLPGPRASRGLPARVSLRTALMR